MQARRLLFVIFSLSFVTGDFCTIDLLSSFTQGLGVVGPLLVEPIKLRSAPWKVAKSRIELLESLNQDPGLEAGGLTVKKVMEV